MGRAGCRSCTLASWAPRDTDNIHQGELQPASTKHSPTGSPPHALLLPVFGLAALQQVLRLGFELLQAERDMRDTLCWWGAYSSRSIPAAEQPAWTAMQATFLHALPHLRRRHCAVAWNEGLKIQLL